MFHFPDITDRLEPWLQRKIQKFPNNNKWLAHSSHLVDCPGFNPGVLRCIITPPITEVLSASDIDLTSNTSQSLYAILLLNPLHSQKPLFLSVSKKALQALLPLCEPLQSRQQLEPFSLLTLLHPPPLPPSSLSKPSSSPSPPKRVSSLPATWWSQTFFFISAAVNTLFVLSL